MKTIPYGRQHIAKADIEKVVKVLGSDWITQGHKVSEFENALAKYCGCKYAVAVSSGIAALHLACLAANIREGDRVISTPNTFVASTNCVLFCGGRPEFVDIEARTANIDAGKIDILLGALESEPTARVKAIIPVHFAGLPCNMYKIKEIAMKHNLIIIEDACHAVGAEYKYNGEWIKVGSCKHSDMAAFSFHPVKHITTGEGGAILTNSPELYERLLRLRNHGITKNPEKFTNECLAFDNTSSSETKLTNPWYYEMYDLGYNYRITDIQCALGISQLNRINESIERRRSIASRYNDAFKGLYGVQVSVETEIERSSYHLYVLQIDFEKIGKSRAGIMYELKRKGIGTQVHYIPVYLHPYYKETLHCDSSNYPVTEMYYKRCLSLPIFPKMSGSEVNYITEHVGKILKV